MSSATYTFRLDSFRIDNTRARHNDTDAVALYLKVGDRSYGTQTKQMGDLNNGTYNVDLEFPNIRIDDPNTPIIFNYQIINAGNFNGNIEDRLQNGAETLAGTLLDKGVWGAVVGGAIEALNLAYTVFTVNCDGPVAVDEIVVPRSQLDEWTANGAYTETRSYPGSDSPHGCGSNSQYSVTWSLIPIVPAHASQNSSSAVARIPEHLDVFWVTPDGAIASTWGDTRRPQGFWNQPAFPIAASDVARPNCPVAAVARMPDQLDAFWVQSDGAIGTNWWNAQANNAAWNQPFTIAPPQAARADSPVAAVARTPDNLDVFWIGPDGAVMTNWGNINRPGGFWSQAPFAISPPGATRPNSPLAAVSRTDGHLDVFWIGPDGAIMTNWGDTGRPGGFWSPDPFPLSTPGDSAARSGIAAIARPAHLDVFWIGADGAVRTTWGDINRPGGFWNPMPFSIAPAGAARLDSAVAAAARTNSHLDVFWIRGDGAVWSTWGDAQRPDGFWNLTPYAISGPADGAPGSFLAAVSRYSEQLDVFWAGTDGAVRTNWWNLHANQAAWNQPFAIAPAGSAHL